MEARTQALRFVGGSFDPLRGELRIGERQARLRPRSASVLAVLMGERGRVVGREELMRQVWPDAVVTDDSLAQCIKEIRRALGPAADCIRTIPRLGYAFADAAAHDATVAKAAPATAEAGVLERVPAESAAATVPAPVAAECDAATVAAPATAESTTTTVAPRTSRWRWWAIGFALVLVGLVALWLSMAPQLHSPSPYSIVVLPLSTAGSRAGADDFADSIANDLTTDLSSIPGTLVIARSTADRYRGKTIDARSIGRELDVRYVVEGSVQHAGAEVVLNLRLVDAQADGIVWSERFAGAPDDLGALQGRVTARIARTLQLVLIEDVAARANRHPSVSPEEALELFRAQLRDNPGYAPAWMWAAMAQLQLGDYAAAAASADQAIRLSPHDTSLPFFYSVLSRARLYGGDAAGALSAAEQAVRSPGPNRYAPLLVASAAMELGDTERARRVMADFLERNPGTTAASLRASRGPIGPRTAEREERYIASLVAVGLPLR